MLAAAFVAAESCCLAHTPNANPVQVWGSGDDKPRLNAQASGTIPNVSATPPAVKSDRWFRAATQVAQAVLPKPSPVGMISKFVNTAANWHNATIIDGKQWYNHHGGRPWSLTKLDDNTLRMEVRRGDPEAIDVGGERSEISSGFKFAAGVLIDVQFTFMIEPGDSLQSPKATWLSILQIHGDTRTAVITMDGEHMQVVGNFDTGTKAIWKDPNPIVRGQNYKMRLQVQRGSNGFIKFWRDDALLLDRTLAMSGTDNYLKLGIYRGWPGAVPQTMAVRYSGIATPP